MHPAKQLLQLQTLDLERDGKFRRLKQVNASLVEPEAVQAAGAAVAAAQAETARTRSHRQDLELETPARDRKIRAVDEQLYSGRVKNPKELADLQNDAASLRRRHAALDDMLLEAMIAVEEAEQAEKNAQNRQADVRAQWQAQQHVLLDERRQLEADMAALTQQRNQMLAAIPADALKPYQKLRHERGGVAVAPVENDVCGACGEEISDRLLAKARMSEGLTFCANCERILVTE